MKDSSKTGIAPEPSLFVMRFEKNYCSLNKTRFLEILQDYPLLLKPKNRPLNCSRNRVRNKESTPLETEEVYESNKTNSSKQKSTSHRLYHPRPDPLDFGRCCMVLFLRPNAS